MILRRKHIFFASSKVASTTISVCCSAIKKSVVEKLMRHAKSSQRYFRQCASTVSSRLMIVLVAILTSVSAMAEVQQGEKLNRASNAAAILGGIFSVVSDTRLDGKIQSVTVTKVVENEVRLKLDYQGFKGSTIKVYAADHGGKKITQISTAKYKAPSDKETASTSLTLSLSQNLSSSAELQTDLVIFSISKPNSPSLPLRLVSFHFDKEWTHQIAPENVVVQLRAVPIGNTSRAVSDAKRGIQTTVSAVVKRGAVKMETVDTARRRLSAVSATRLNSSLTDSRNSQLRAALVKSQKASTNSATAVIKPKTQTSRSATTTTAANNSVDYANVIKALPKGNFDFSKLARNPKASFVSVNPQQTQSSTEPTNQVTRNAVRWYEAITEQGVDVDLRDVLGIYNIYQDSNINSGVYYFVPKNYGLSYNADYPGAEGLGLRISYDRSNSDSAAQDSSIRVAMTLGSGLDNQGIALASRILQKLDTRDPSFKFRQLQPLPTGGPVSFDFSTGLFNIVDPESIVVLSYSDLLEDISVSFASDELEAERVRTNLEDPALGIPGEVVFPLPSLDGEPSAEIIPARVNLAEPRAYEALTWSDNSEIRNQSPLPLTVSRLHMLDVDYGLGPIVYSWELGNVSVPSRSKLELDKRDLPEALLSRAEHIWFEYEFDPSCGDCLVDVVDDVVIANVMKERTDLSLKLIAPFACHDVFALKLDIRSHFFDPTEQVLRSGVSQYYEASEPLTGFINIGSVFLDDNSNSESEGLPFYEYRLSEILNNGEVRESDQWLPYSGEVLFLGSSQIQQSFPGTPCLADDTGMNDSDPVDSDSDSDESESGEG